MSKIFNYFSVGVFIIVLITLIKQFNKDNFYSVKEEQLNLEENYYRTHGFTNQVVPATQTNYITKTDLESLFNQLIKVNYSNGPPKGSNISVDQNDYDLIFKDILISSDKRNNKTYPNPNNYAITLNINMDKIYKAELIEVYVPAATDDTVNIPYNANRLYFKYTSEGKTTSAFVIIQPGTYESPLSIAEEMTRQFNIVLYNAGFTLTKTVGIKVIYNRNINRYIFTDRDYSESASGNLIIYPDNGTIVEGSDITVIDSICPLLMLNYTNDEIKKPYISGPKYIYGKGDLLEIGIAKPGDYGQYETPPGTVLKDVSLYYDCIYSNSIISDLVLTDCKIFLSLGKLDGETCNLITDESGRNYEVPPIFCQVPNNTCVSSSAVKTLLNQPSNYSSIQFYNPPISKVNKINVKWYSESGQLLRILDHCFTVRVHYFQKRLGTTDFSYPVP